MSRTRLFHLLWYQLSEDEQTAEIHSVIQLALFGYPIKLSERVMTLPCHYEEGEEDYETD